MKRWERALVGPDTTLREALETIDKAACQIALVVDESRRLLGTLSDGDARRGLLKGLGLADKVTAAMHVGPTCAQAGDDRSSNIPPSCNPSLWTSCRGRYVRRAAA